MIRGFRKALLTTDLWLLRKEETTDYNRSLFADKWEEAMKRWRAEQVATEAEKISESSLSNSENNVTDSNPQMNARSSNDAVTNIQRRKQAGQQKTKRGKPPLVKILLKVYGLYILFSQLLMVLYVFFYYVNPCLFW